MIDVCDVNNRGFLDDLQWEVATDDLIDNHREEDNSDGSCDDSEWEETNGGVGGGLFGSGSFGGGSLDVDAVGTYITRVKQGGRLQFKLPRQGRKRRHKRTGNISSQYTFSTYLYCSLCRIWR